MMRAAKRLSVAAIPAIAVVQVEAAVLSGTEDLTVEKRKRNGCQEHGSREHFSVEFQAVPSVLLEGDRK
ncbi:hypothetical protein [Rhizobium sullae]|uniref:hypothetical protein n=1 Tax=Rhizobium sullae TaxID=50338 RepID=UPI000B3507E8|nr:hypothetical protein [Rhizobium sullae]